MDGQEVTNRDPFNMCCVATIVVVCCTSINCVMAQSATVDVIARVQGAIEQQNAYIDWQDRIHEVGTNELHSLIHHKNDVIAVAAAWESFVIRPAALQLNGDHRIGTSNAIRFLSFCEGRLGIHIPCLYERLLAKGVIRNHCTLIEETPESRKAARRLGPGISTTQTTGVVLKNDEIVLTGQSAKLTLTGRVLSDNPPFFGGIAFTSVGERFWVVGYDSKLLQRSRLVCIDRGLKKWQADVWCSIDYCGTSGEGYYHICMIECRDNIVYVYGIGWSGFYIEGFNANEGAVVFRFLSTTIGDARDGRAGDD